MALLPSFFLDCVVSIGVPNKTEISWVGTGTLVGKPIDSQDESDEKKYHIFLVTNKHVLKNKKDIILRFNHSHEHSAKDFPIDLQPDGKPLIWVGHHTDEIDLATFPINADALEQRKLKYNVFRLDEDALRVPSMKRNGVSEGDSVFILGFPMGNVSIPGNYNYAISRSGSIARIRDLLEGQQSSFLIDANIFPGNSGGPVVSKPELVSLAGTHPMKKGVLIGIVKAYIPFRDVAISNQTGSPRIIFEENSGLAVVETVDSIDSTIDLWLKKKNTADAVA